MLRILLLQAILLSPVSSADAPVSTRLLEKVFKDVLRPEQIAALKEPRTPERLVLAMTPDQKEASRAKLQTAEETSSEVALKEIRQGYQLLGATADALRIQMRLEGRLPRSARTQSDAAMAAYEQGRIDDALKLAAEALAKDPEDARAAAILKLAKPKVGDKELNLQNLFAEKADGGAAAPQPAAVRRPTPQASGFVRKAVEARRAGNLDGALDAALNAMRADPTSPLVQEFYREVIADRSAQMRRLGKVMSLLEDAVNAKRSGNRERAVNLAEQASALDHSPFVLKIVADIKNRSNTFSVGDEKAPRRPNPALPSGAGALLTIAAFLVWELAGRKELDARIREAKRSACLAALGLGAIGIGYGGWLMIASASAAAPVAPTFALAGGGTLEEAAVADGALKAGLAVGVARLASGGYSYARSDSAESKSETDKAQSSKKRWGNPDTLPDHFQRHGPDFEAKSEQDYVDKAVEFLQRAEKDGLPRKVDQNGNIRIYDPKSKTFGSYNADGSVKTFYKPDPAVHGMQSNLDYWTAQPGNPR